MVAQGTPAYMAPEAALSPEIDSQADIYSLGVTLYRMLLGKLPFDHNDPVEILRMHIEEEPRGLDGGELPGALSELIRRMLDKDAKKRPMAKDLPREIAALERAIPGLDKSSLWELVDGGEATLPVPGEQSALSLEPTNEMSFVQTQAPASAKPWDSQPIASPSASQRLSVTTAATGRAAPITGIGLGTMALALVLCVVYIVFYTMQPPPENKPDPQVEQLRSENSGLRAELKAERDKQPGVREFLAKAAQKLRDEDADEQAAQGPRPQRASLDEIMAEINELRASHSAAEVPGAGD